MVHSSWTAWTKYIYIMQSYIEFNQRLKENNRRLWLERERARYTYLPTLDGMKAGGYTEMWVGTYECTAVNSLNHRLTILSQTSMLLAFRDEVYVGAQVVENDEELLRFLLKHNFPLPA
jgi:hypothetical protein